MTWLTTLPVFTSIQAGCLLAGYFAPGSGRVLDLQPTVFTWVGDEVVLQGNGRTLTLKVNSPDQRTWVQALEARMPGATPAKHRRKSICKDLRTGETPRRLGRGGGDDLGDDSDDEVPGLRTQVTPGGQPRCVAGHLSEQPQDAAVPNHLPFRTTDLNQTSRTSCIGTGSV